VEGTQLANSIPPPSAWDIQILKRTCFGEAADQGDEGMLAQAWSMVNRRHAGRWYSGTSYAEMCLLAIAADEPQYDCWLSHNAARQPIADWLRTVNTPDDDPVMLRCEAAVMAAINGTQFDPTGGASHYYDISIPAPLWTVGAALTLALGKLRFYKDVK
jgi:N-acetylmuramoyl-L-alanine amidase